MKTKLLFITILLSAGIHQLRAQTVSLIPFVSGFSTPIDVRHCGDDRIFVAERGGRIRIINPDGTLRPIPFLDISSKVSSTNSEEGFLGFCFSPNYLTDGKFYVSYTDSVGSNLFSVVEEYRVSADANIANPATALPIITVQKPYQNHNGGNIFFGRDNYLYIFWGDGGSGGDPFNNGLNTAVLPGKILRLDVSNSSNAQPYTIPPSNPFATAPPPTRREIWAYGLRNPWRNSFDRITGDLWIGDVGQNAVEEINFQAASSIGGENYGWKTMEGTACFDPPNSCNQTGLKLPIHDFNHPLGRSVTGGNVYRSVQSRDLWGIYIFSDFAGRWFDGFRQVNGVISGSVQRLFSDAPNGPISLGEDRYGELYACLLNNGTLFKVEDANPNRFPKAYFTVVNNGGNYSLHALEGRNITYQWLLNDLPIGGATGITYAVTQNGQYKLAVRNAAGNEDISEPFILNTFPVTLKYFSAKRVAGKDALLQWATASELNNLGFYIERKFEGETSFRNIGFLASQAPDGNSTMELNYSYTDHGAGIAAVQYRLRQTDLDGKAAYSAIESLAAARDALGISIVSNPARGIIRVVTGRAANYDYRIWDASGRLLQRGNFNGTIMEISTRSFQKGLYFIQVLSAQTKESVLEKVIL